MCGRWSPTAPPSARANWDSSTSKITSPACDAARGNRAGGGHLQHCHKRVRKGQPHRQASQLLRTMPRPCQVPAAPAVLHLVRALRGHAFGTVVIAYSAAFSACENSPAAPAGLTALASDAAPCQRAGCVCLRCRHQRGRKVPAAPAGPHLSRARWRHAIVPHVGGLAVRASHRQMARGRVSPRRKTPAVRARVVAHRGRGGLAESSVAPSNDPFRLARRRVLHCLRARPRHASAPDVFAYSAASSACRRYQQHQQAFISHVRWGAMPPCRL